MTKVPLVDVKRLDAVVESIGKNLDPPQIEFMKARWLHQIIYWDERSRDSRRKYFSLRLVMVLGGVTIPVLVSLGAREPALTTAAAIISAAVAAAAAWEGVANYGQIWLEKRRAAELLKVEGWLYLQHADKYVGQDYKTGFPTFAAEVERQIAKEVGEYVASFDVEAATTRVSQASRLLDAAGVRTPSVTVTTENPTVTG
jgi:hypothetical protein